MNDRRFMNRTLAFALTASLLSSSIAWAKVTQEEADKLGTVLTPMGAIKEGNKEGTIPPFSGKILGAPAWVKYEGSGTHFPDPYPNEKPLFTITHDNYQDYKDNLSIGEIALFEKYPTFQMPIYQSKRDFRYSDKVYENTKLNALETDMVSEGNGTTKAFFGTPFPLPKSGVELIWNHQASPNYGLTAGALDTFAVYKNGEKAYLQNLEERDILYYDPNLTREQFNAQPYGGKVMVQVMAPANQKGEIILVHEYRDVSNQSRDAWQYLPGTRRVRTAPTISYDFPAPPGNLRTVDDVLLFNGATDRYTWKMEPSREIYIPYNDNILDDPKLKYDDFLKSNHVDPKVMRYELHRCWVVVGELRPGKRHIYAKRRLYLDEDSWAGVLAESYDGRGNLWRSNMRTMTALYDMPGMGPRVEMYHDLQSGDYLANYLVNEVKGPPKIVTTPWPDDYFTVQQVRKMGKR
jgi:hypothetical protein